MGFMRIGFVSCLIAIRIGRFARCVHRKLKGQRILHTSGSAGKRITHSQPPKLLVSIETEPR